MSTTIYLDVDGVINAIRKNAPTQTGFTDYRRTNVNGYQIQYAQELVDHLNTISERDDVTIVWLTTWEHDAARTLSPAIGLNGHNWEVLTGDQHAWGGRNWWKLGAIRDHVEEKQPDLAIWIDDDIKLERDAINWAETTGSTIAISPNPLDGINNETIEAIIELLNR